MRKKTICVDCGRDSGLFHFVGQKWYCDHCFRGVRVRDTSKDLYNFETMNISSDPNKGPVRVQSLRHLRQLEVENGVHSVALNMNSSNWER